MAYDHTEQEQLDSIKAWWKQYGNLIMWTLIIVLGGFAGWKGWGAYQVKQAQQASVRYEELQKVIQNKDRAQVSQIVTDLQQNFSGTGYAQMASMLVAKHAFELNDLNTAKLQLSWVIDHGKSDEFKSIAKIRLAGILLDEKLYDEALGQLNGEFSPELASSVADRKGDILMAQNNIEGARAAYQLAIEKSVNQNPAQQLIQLKLDAIGPTSSAPTSKAAN